jgi:hypothetical protein
MIQVYSYYFEWHFQGPNVIDSLNRNDVLKEERKKGSEGKQTMREKTF